MFSSDNNREICGLFNELEYFLSVLEILNICDGKPEYISSNRLNIKKNNGEQNENNCYCTDET